MLNKGDAYEPRQMKMTVAEVIEYLQYVPHPEEAIFEGYDESLGVFWISTPPRD